MTAKQLVRMPITMVETKSNGPIEQLDQNHLYSEYGHPSACA
jgi:hypothetical protein